MGLEYGSEESSSDGDYDESENDCVREGGGVHKDSKPTYIRDLDRSSNTRLQQTHAALLAANNKANGICTILYSPICILSYQMHMYINLGLPSTTWVLHVQCIFEWYKNHLLVWK